MTMTTPAQILFSFLWLVMGTAIAAVVVSLVYAACGRRRPGPPQPEFKLWKPTYEITSKDLVPDQSLVPLASDLHVKLMQKVEAQLAAGNTSVLFPKGLAQLVADQLGVPADQVKVGPVVSFAVPLTNAPNVQFSHAGAKVIWGWQAFLRSKPGAAADHSKLDANFAAHPVKPLELTVLDVPPGPLPMAITARCRCERCSARWKAYFGRQWLPVISPITLIDPRINEPVYRVKVRDAHGEEGWISLQARQCRLRIGALEVEG